MHKYESLKTRQNHWINNHHHNKEKNPKINNKTKEIAAKRFCIRIWFALCVWCASFSSSSFISSVKLCRCRTRSKCGKRFALLLVRSFWTIPVKSRTISTVSECDHVLQLINIHHCIAEIFIYVYMIHGPHHDMLILGVCVFADFMSQNISLLLFICCRWFAIVSAFTLCSAALPDCMRTTCDCYVLYSRNFLARGPEDLHTHMRVHRIAYMHFWASNNFYSMLHKTSTENIYYTHTTMARNFKLNHIK